MIISKIGLFCFPVLRFLVPCYRKSPCYWQAVLQYNSLSPKQKDCSRINILLDAFSGRKTWGHSWLTVNGKPFKRREVVVSVPIECIGSSGIYDYWVVTTGMNNNG